MGIRKTESGWRVDIRPSGRDGKRIRKTFKTKAEALRFEAFQTVKHVQGVEWEAPKKDSRRLSALIDRWFALHGIHLKDGKARRGKLQRIAQALGNPSANTFTAHDFTHYRAERLKAGISASTLNHDLAYLRALFNELERLGEWKGGNPVLRIRQLKIDERELTYLTREQIAALLTALNESRNLDAAKVARVCLSTGARWTEAQTLRAEQVQRYRITFWGTKNGKIRTVPITSELYEIIHTTRTGRLFKPCYDAFRNAVERAGLILPEGQMTHVLRHSFASHFMMNGGNILALQRILGHGTLTMTMRYAHLAPEHLEEAARLNPLQDL